MSERAPMQDTLGSDGTYQATLPGVEPAESESEPRYRDEQWLREQYVGKELSTYEIAEKCECGDSTVHRWLQEHGIERRARRQAVDERLDDSEWLHEQYVGKELSTYEIAEKCECSNGTVYRRLQRYSIETRAPNTVADKRLEDAEWLHEQYVEKELTTDEIAERCECSDATVFRWLQRHAIETRTPEIDERLRAEDWLREQYVEKELTTDEIAERCECGDSTVHRWLQEHGIERRASASELSGENSPFWKGGPAPYGPGWSESKRRHVRERDNYTCQASDCDTTQSEHRERHGQKLHVHHLRKARDVDDPEERNAAENLVTLCRECHNRWEKVADAGLVPQFPTVADD